MGGIFTGTVKSYNAKGFGFILSESVDHDIYFSRESLQQGLRTANIAGTMVSFELARGPGGKPLARNLRPVHGVPPNFYNARGSSSSFGGGCGGCGPRFVMPQPPGAFPGQMIGHPGHLPGQMPGHSMMPAPAAPPMVMPRPVRSLSPHAGSRAIAGLKKEEERPKSRGSSSSSDSDAGSKRKRDSSGSSGSSSRKKRKKKKSKKKKHKRARSESSGSGDEKKKKRRRSSSSSSSSSSEDRPEVVKDGDGKDGEGEKEGNKEIEEAKREALKKLQSLQGIANKESRMKEWRALLRTWHPDKNPENVEVATAVFQFLQKGKVLLDGN